MKGGNVHYLPVHERRLTDLQDLCFNYWVKCFRFNMTWMRKVIFPFNISVPYWLMFLQAGRFGECLKR